MNVKQIPTVQEIVLRKNCARDLQPSSLLPGTVAISSTKDKNAKLSYFGRKYDKKMSISSCPSSLLQAKCVFSSCHYRVVS